MSEVRSILVIGAGPVAIGSGQELATMAALGVLALRRAGVRVVAVDSNSNALATELADQGYAEPIEPGAIAAIALWEKVDAILPMFGGVPALEACALLDDSAPILGAPASTRKKVLDRSLEHEESPKARRVELELVRTRESTVIVGAVEYLAKAPVHVGDSMAVVLFPDAPGIAELAVVARALLAELDVIGCASALFSIATDGSSKLASLRLGSGRTSTLLARALGYPVAEAGAFAAIGHPFAYEPAPGGLFAHRTEPVFSFDRFPGADTSLGPQMKSFGRVISRESWPPAPAPSKRPHLLFVGGGPVRVEQGMEADAAVARGVLAARALGYETSVLDANPDALAPLLADRAHVGPIRPGEIRVLYTQESAVGVVLQLGGEPALALAESLEGLALVGTSAASVSRAAALGEGDRTEPRLINAPKIGVECLSDGTRAVLAGVFEYVERAGVHPRDSAAILPPFSLPEDTVRAMEEAARAAAQTVGVRGLVSVEVAYANGKPVILGVRAGAGSALSFTVKGTGRDLVGLGLRLALGATLEELGLVDEPAPAHVAARECSFPFSQLPGSAPGLGPSARAVGEAMSVGATLAAAYDKALRGVDIRVERPVEGSKNRRVVLVPSEADRSSASDLARRLRSVGFELSSSASFDPLLVALRIPHVTVSEADVVRALVAGEVSFVIATEDAELTKTMRREALALGVPCITTIQLARAVCAAIEESNASARVRPLP